MRLSNENSLTLFQRIHLYNMFCLINDEHKYGMIMKYFLTLAMSALMSFQVMATDLTSKDVTQWLASMPVLEPWQDEHEEEFTDQLSEPSSPETAYKETISDLKKAGLYDELNGKVKKLGYNNVEQWMEITYKVSFAWMALEMENQKSDMAAAKAQYDAMKNNPDVPAAQKEMMEKMMAPLLAMVNMANQSSAADKSAVKPYLAELNAYFNK